MNRSVVAQRGGPDTFTTSIRGGPGISSCSVAVATEQEIVIATFDASALRQLRSRVRGAVILPQDADYRRWATPWNLAASSTPAAVVVVRDAGDVVETIRFARASGLRVDVRSTGHGAGPVDDRTVLIRTDALDEIHVVAQGRARGAAGVRLQQLIDAAAPHGLAPLSGSSPGVGVVGFVTGGGVGPVSRSYGLGSDHVCAIEVVTGDGAVHRATANDDAELFWALRGGRGALGVVTEIEIDLLPLTTFYGGALYFDGADVPAVLHAWLAWSRDLPEQASTTVAVLNLPSLPTIPPPIAGRTTIAVRFAWTGDVQQGVDIFAPLRTVADVIFGAVEQMPYTRIGDVHSDGTDPMPTWESAVTLDQLPARAFDEVVPLVVGAANNPQLLVEIRRLGGQLASAPRTEDVITFRDAAFSLLTVGIVSDAAELEAVRRHADQLGVALSPWSRHGGLANLGGAATPTTVRGIYDAATIQRLAGLIAKHDPDTVLVQGDALREAHAGGSA